MNPTSEYLLFIFSLCNLHIDCPLEHVLNCFYFALFYLQSRAVKRTRKFKDINGLALTRLEKCFVMSPIVKVKFEQTLH